MSAIILPMALLGASICSAFGTARLIGWCIDQRDAARRREIREQQIVSQARAEVRRG